MVAALLSGDHRRRTAAGKAGVRLLAALALGLALGAPGFGQVQRAAADSTVPSQSVTFTCQGFPQTFSVPPGVTSITYQAAGGSGAGTSNASGGNGAYITGNLTVTPGELLTITVGCSGSSSGYGWANGGAGNGGYSGGGGNGGGATGIAAGSTLLVVASGGGGAGGQGFFLSSDYAGGNGGSGQGFAFAPIYPGGSGGGGSPSSLGGGGGGNCCASGSTGGQGGGGSSGGGGGGGGGGGYAGGDGGGGGGLGGGGGGGAAGRSYVNTGFATMGLDPNPTESDGYVKLTLLNAVAGAGPQVFFNCFPPIQNYTVPDGVTSLLVTAIGADGGTGSTTGSPSPFNNDGSGGWGAAFSGHMAVTPGDTLNVTPGCAGLASSYNGNDSSGSDPGGSGGPGLGPGGNGGAGSGLEGVGDIGHGGCGGGGGSGLFSDGTLRLIAGGGGGCGGLGGYGSGGNGSAADWLTDPGSNGTGLGAGTGGGGGAGSYLAAGGGGSACCDTQGGGGGGGGGGWYGGNGGGNGGAGGGGGAGGQGGLNYRDSTVSDLVTLSTDERHAMGLTGGLIILTPLFPTPQDLTVSTTATPSFTRTFSWGIGKSVDTPQQTIAPGTLATFHYTVNVTHDGGTDSAWEVAGTLTVHNPNAFDVTGVTLGEATDNGGICSVTNGANLTVPANGSVTASYTCGYAAAPSPGSGTATAMASWADYGAPDTSATGTASFDFGTTTPTVKDGYVTVSDSLQGPLPLGVVLSSDPSPRTFSYSYTFAGTPGVCTAYPNTATYTTDDTQTSGSASQTVTVCKQARITATSLPINATEGAPFNGAVATFTTDAAPNVVQGTFRATIDWGDGTPPSPGRISANGDGSYSVSGDHLYAEEGSYATTVTIMDGQGGSSSTGGRATVADAALTATGGITVRATEGQAFTGQAVATFRDANPGGPESDYSATIDWGDGTAASPGTVRGGGGGDVSGSHTYAEEGAYTITVKIDDVGGSHTSTTSTVTVADAPLTARGGLTFQATEGQASTSQTVATFTDADPNGTLSDYSATITWGDGATSAGTISANADGSFSVNSSHTYAEEGRYPIKVTITDKGGSQTAASSMASVADPAVAATGGVTVQATEGHASTSQTVATFSDPGGAEAPGDYSATVDWGDGTPASTGTITANGDGTFSVAGGHTYAEEGAYTVTVTIAHEAAPTVTVTSTAQVSDAPLSATGKSILSGTGTAFSGAVATFGDADPNGTLSDYSASIDWGDGTPASTGTISANADGSFSVSGSHTYAALGPYTVTVSIADAGGSTATATTSLLAFAYLAQGSFTLGDLTVAHATPSTDVMWWGADWDQWAGGDNLSGGPAPAAFKGFVQSMSSTPPVCGGNWTTGTGDSPAPPSSVPSYMAVLVPSTVTQSGSTITGNIVHIVVVKTDPGYGPNPGHAGTGTIVAQVC